MKAIGIFRGFPGLGRVVAGLDIFNQLRKYSKFEAIIYTYLQGAELSKSYNYKFKNIKSINDISSIGIIPVSKSGEAIINSIEEYNPDFVLIDGEPLLVTTIKLRFPKLIVIALLNPFDIKNPNNQLSSQLFFKDCYSKANIAIVHGLWKVAKPQTFQNSFHSINTLIRHEVEEINPDRNVNKIACVLGGGSVNSSEQFFENTILISQFVIELAGMHHQFLFEIYCGCETVFSRVNHLVNRSENVKLHRHLHKPTEIYNSTKAVFSRAGRNSTSELLSINLPAILLSTNCEVRGAEQQENISFAEKYSSNIIGVSLSSDLSTFENQFNKIISKEIDPVQWNSGNKELIEILKSELPCM